MLEASGGEIPRCDPEGVPDHLECLPGHSLSLAATPPPPPVCVTAASLAHGPTWLRSVSDSSVLSADPNGCALVCLASPGQPWPCSVALYHLLSTDIVTCWTRRSTLAAVPVPPPPWGAGWKQGCHCCPRCARLVSLGPRLIPPGPLGGSPHQNFGAELLRPRASGCGVSRPRPPPKPLGPRTLS